MVFIDDHCHLDLSKNISEAVARAKKARVEIIVVNGVDSKTNKAILKLAEKYPEVKAALGMYPIDALKLSDEEIQKEISFIRKNKDKVVAIGEIGMDFKEAQEEERQRKNFRAFIDLAIEIDKPVEVHTRKAEKECIEVLKESRAKKVVMHCFFGKLSLVDEIIKQGWSLSIPTNVVFNEQMQEVVKRTPISQILCETDSPYMHPFREGENEPALVVEGYKKIADIKGLPLREVEKQIEINYKKLFK